jgi:hypothetical protein
MKSETTSLRLVALSDIAHGRSGDKGNHANIAVLAYTQKGYDWLREHLTAEVVAAYFASFQPSKVVRFEAPNLLGLNFLLYNVLGGGASQSLRVDSQGKTMALALLSMAIESPPGIEEMVREQKEEPK